MMRDLFSNVETLCTVCVVISATEEFAQNRIVRFLYSLRFDVPACEVVLKNTDETFLRIVALFGTDFDVMKIRMKMSSPAWAVAL